MLNNSSRTIGAWGSVGLILDGLAELVEKAAFGKVAIVKAQPLILGGCYD